MSFLPETVAILVSGGVDSCVLLAEALACCRRVHPLFIRGGLYWEEAELEHLHRFLAAVRTEALAPLTILDMPAGDLYGEHWSMNGDDVPDASQPDEAVYLPGRNVLLLAKALIWCRLHGVEHLALAPLKANPFPDATPEFFAEFARVVSGALEAPGGPAPRRSVAVSIHRPYAELGKADVLRRSRRLGSAATGTGELPLEWTFSCMRPEAGLHCGVCGKCGERRRAFVAAGLPDRTPYRHELPELSRP